MRSLLQADKVVYSHATYKNPVKNRITVINQKLVVRLERADEAKARNSVGKMIARRPRVSARKPQRCELQMMPANEMALSTPFSLVVSSRSHSATGST